MAQINLSKKPVFVLTYNEQELWCSKYPVEEFNTKFSNYQFIILDNGQQPLIEDWCNQTNSYYYASEYNIGSTGGYNWIFKVANLLEYDRAVLTQADVEILDICILDNLFEDWKDNQIPFFPQVDKTLWDQTGQVYNLGQLFSFNPNFILSNDFTNDENYVVTHYDDADLLRRMRDWGVDLVNCLLKYYPNVDCVQIDKSHVAESLYKIHHWSSLQQDQSDNHEKWLRYNNDYHKDKWGGDGMPQAYPFNKLQEHEFNDLDSEISNVSGYTEQMKYNVNKRLPHSARWTDLGYLPYPIEHEINRFWCKYLKDLGISHNI
tara:strand:+ start:538 stop:1494 length:957 start_codon:yes stop_codon:yes gene_type:complete